MRYLNAVLGDLNNEVGQINVYYRWFLVTSILFFALSPQWFGFILPALFFVPIFLGMKGVKTRSQNGLYMSLSVAPIGLMAGAMWLNYGIKALGDYEAAVTANMASAGLGPQAAQLLTIVAPVFGVVLVISAIMTTYYGYKTRKLFV